MHDDARVSTNRQCPRRRIATPPIVAPVTMPILPSPREVAVDLGTSNVLVWSRGEGLLMAAPSVVAVRSDDGDLLATGFAARSMLGRTGPDVAVIQPLREGVIDDFDAAVMLLRHALGASLPWRLRPVDVIVCAPLGLTAVERRALEEAVRATGARGAHVMEEPLAAAIGAGLPVAEATGSMVVDIGGGTSEIAVICLGGIVSAESVRVGGRDLDEAVRLHMRHRHDLAIGPTTAEELKIALGHAGGGDGRTAEVTGRALASGLPRTVEVTDDEIAQAIDEPLSRILEAVRRSLATAPPELASDVMDLGLLLTGGGSLLRGLDDRLRAELGIPVHPADDPLGAVVRGAGMALEEMRTIRRASGAGRRRSHRVDAGGPTLRRR